MKVVDQKAPHRIDQATKMEQRCLLRILGGGLENGGNLVRSSGVLTEGLRSMELRNKETQVRCVGLDSS